MIVTGGGHAASEAALASVRLGKRVLLVTMDIKNICAMPCNPSVGGPGKAQIVSEIDALGGEMGLAVDACAIELRLLNSSKGPAVQSLRAQIDKKAYSRYMSKALIEAGVHVRQGMVTEVLVRNGKVKGVSMENKDRYYSPVVILATGVYLESRIVIGEDIKESGPLGEHSAKGLSSSLRDLGFTLNRFKTGTSPRLRGRSIRWDLLKKEEGLEQPRSFSFISRPRIFKEDVCYSTYTTFETHDIIRKNAHRAPLFDGTIEGVGPRYCPSIEDKVMRFPDKERHQIYLEMESLDSDQVYILGLSTSLPLDVQEKMVKSLRGLEDAVITAPGYAIEYDYIVSSQLTPYLSLGGVEGLYSAGQLNGTSGYEEAAAQGLICGINASLWLDGSPQVVLERDRAYIGVLIDDIVGKEIEEPYRMLTARAEYRLLLRQTNADTRLTPLGREVGLVSDSRWSLFCKKKNELEAGRKALEKRTKKGILKDVLRKPRTKISSFLGEIPELSDLSSSVLQEIEVEAKYSGFIARQEREAKRLKSYSDKKIPVNIDLSKITGLSKESVDKLKRYRPATLRSALDAGVSPQDSLILLTYLRNSR